MIRVAKRMATLIGRNLDGLLFALWLGAIGWLLLTGNDKAFLHPRFRLFLAVGGLLLAVFMGVVLIGPKRQVPGWQCFLKSNRALE